MGNSVSIQLVAVNMGFLWSFHRWDRPSLEVWGESQDSSWIQAGELALILRREGGTWGSYRVVQESWGSSWVTAGILGNPLICIKGVKPPFKFQEGTWIALKLLQGKRASSHTEWWISWFFSSCDGKLLFLLDLWPRLQGTSLDTSGKSSLLSSCEEWGIALFSKPQ